jgi:hypothetical protein
LACLFAIWTLSDLQKNNISYDDSSKGIEFTFPLLQPHPAQVISILRIFGVGFDKIVPYKGWSFKDHKEIQMSKYLAENIKLFNNLI